MNYARLALTMMLFGCPSDAASPGDTEGDTGSPTAEGPACDPGSTLPCACSSGAMGIQTCAPDGMSYGACECMEVSTSSGAGTGTTFDSSSTTTTTDPATEGTSESSSSGSESSSSEGSTTAVSCEDAAHPLVEGDLRYCEEGYCYCGDLRMKPPLDICYAESIADACCPVDLTCY